MSDPYLGSVKFLSHFNSDLSDFAGHTATAAGNAAVSATQSKFGGSSLGLDGTGDWLSYADSADWDMPGDFTIEGFVYATTFAVDAAQRGILSFREPGSAAANKMALLINSSGYLNVYTNSAVLTSSVIFTLNTWWYFAITRSGTTLAIRVGTSGATSSGGTATNSNSFIADKFILGSQSTTSGTGNFPGYIDEVRMTVGIVRDVSTVPTAEFPTDPEYSPPEVTRIVTGLDLTANVVPIHHLYL